MSSPGLLPRSIGNNTRHLVYITPLKPLLLHMRVGDWYSGASVGSGESCRISGQTPDLLNQTLHFTKILS